MLVRRRNRIPWQIILTLLVIVIACISSVVFKQAAQSNSAAFITKTQTDTKKQINDIGLPVRLKIPIINVDTTVYNVGLTSSGAMDIKEDPTKVAWYEFGPRPGEIGNAVIAGHYGWIDNKESIFNNLHNLKKGNEVIITDSNGLSITFSVTESRKFDPNANASSVFYANDNKAHLNLITCDGAWVNSKKSYTDRLVVFTDRK
jgi:LPXTG-site transpeptidase (sortase) family protein